jgi:hypothetical protein
MDNALYTNWDENQQNLYLAQSASSTAFAVSIGTVLTHYCIAAWIWNYKMKDTNDTSPSFVVGLLILCYGCCGL